MILHYVTRTTHKFPQRELVSCSLRSAWAVVFSSPARLWLASFIHASAYISTQHESLLPYYSNPNSASRMTGSLVVDLKTMTLKEDLDGLEDPPSPIESSSTSTASPPPTKGSGNQRY